MDRSSSSLKLVDSTTVTLVEQRSPQIRLRGSRSGVEVRASISMLPFRQPPLKPRTSSSHPGHVSTRSIRCQGPRFSGGWGFL